MKLPNPPEEEQEPEPQVVEPPKTDEKPKWKARFGFLRGTKNESPGETNNPPTTSSQDPAAPASHATRPMRSSGQGGGSTRPLHSSGQESPIMQVLRSSGSKPAVQSSSQEISPTPAAQSSGQGIPSTPPAQGTPLLSNQDDNPGRKLIYIEQAGKNAPPPRIPRKLRLLPNSELTRRAFWDVAATLSLVINAILIGVLIVMALQINHLKTTVNTLSALSNNMLGGLYGNFVKMDQASINTTITVHAVIPLNFTLPVSQNTQVTLTSSVDIPRAHVIINTGGLNINSIADVVIPANTILPIALNLKIPVQYIFPISLQVPVNIPLSQNSTARTI